MGYEQLPVALDGSLAVVNLAGRSIATNFTPEHKRDILESRVETTKQIREAIELCVEPPKKWIQASATGFYGDRKDETIHPESPAGSGFLAEVCKAWESECRVQNLETKRVIVRLGVVCSDQGGALPSLITLTKAFLGGQAGNGKQWLPWIAVEDLARLMAWAIENDAPEVMLGCTRNPIQNSDMARVLRSKYHRPWSPPVPAAMIKLVGKIKGPDACLILDSCRAVADDLGFDYQYPNFEDLPLGSR